MDVPAKYYGDSEPEPRFEAKQLHYRDTYLLAWFPCAWGGATEAGILAAMTTWKEQGHQVEQVDVTPEAGAKGRYSLLRA